MRKIFYAGFCLVLLMGLGCAITDYPVIVDSYKGKVHDIPNRAQIEQGSQVAFIYADGADNLFTQVSQERSSGDQVLFTYNFYTTMGTYFRDYTYCVPNWVGCVIWEAPNPNNPLDDPFDGVFNTSCLGARSLSILASTLRYYGECGANALTVQERLDVVGAGVQIDDHTLQYNLNAQNLSILFANEHGAQSVIPMIGSAAVRYDTQGKGAMAVDASNPLLKNTLNAMADWSDRHGSRVTSMTVLFNGVERTFETRILADNLRANARRM